MKLRQRPKYARKRRIRQKDAKETGPWPCVERQNICVKKLIVPPKNIPCFDDHWPKLGIFKATLKCETKNDNVSSQPKFPTSLPLRQFPRIIFSPVRHNYAVISHKSRNVCCVALNHRNICNSVEWRYRDYSERGNWECECSVGWTASAIY